MSDISLGGPSLSSPATGEEWGTTVSQDGAPRDLAEAGWRPQEAQDQMLLPGRPGAILRPCRLTF